MITLFPATFLLVQLVEAYSLSPKKVPALKLFATFSLRLRIFPLYFACIDESEVKACSRHYEATN